MKLSPFPHGRVGRLTGYAIGIALVGTLLAACGSSDDATEEANNSATSSAEMAATATNYPLTITNANRQVTLAAKPVRIVSLSPTATEDLFAIGAKDQIVAVDDQSTYPAEAPRTALSGFTPNAEAVIGYHPDLVVISGDSNGLVAALETARVPVLVEPSAATTEDVYSQIQELGQVTDHGVDANRTVDAMRSKINNIVTSTTAPASSRPMSYYHEVDNTYYSVTSSTFIGSLYAQFGLKNIADAVGGTNTYPQLSAESIIAGNPEMIFLADSKCCGQSAATVAQRPGWNAISAVAKGNVVALDDDVASRWGPRIVDLVQTVGDAVKKAQAAA